MLRLDWFVRSHSRVSVGASRGPDLGRDRFSESTNIDYEETYSPVMDGITLRYLISFTVHEQLEMHLMDVVTSYLYGSLDNEIYLKIHEGFAMPKSCNSKSR